MCTRTLKLEVTGSELDSDVRVWGTERGSVLACSVTAGGPDDVVDESVSKRRRCVLEDWEWERS